MIRVSSTGEDPESAAIRHHDDIEINMWAFWIISILHGGMILFILQEAVITGSYIMEVPRSCA